jgi:hypothetical protein
MAEAQTPQSTPEEHGVDAHAPRVVLNFWQQPWVQNLLPFATSLSVHLAIIIVGYLAYKTVEVLVNPQAPQEQVIVPSAEIVDNAAVGGIPNPGLGTDPNRAAAQSEFQVAGQGVNERPAQTITESLTGSPNDAGSSGLSLGPRTAATLAGSGTGGGGQGGPVAPFGVPGGGQGQGPRAPFMGMSGNANAVLYVCDGSGSMLNLIAQLRVELQRAITALRPTQAFGVIFFADTDVRPQTPFQQLVMATPDNKTKALEFLRSVVTSGSTDPVPALELAFRMKPQLIYLLTDGDFQDNEKVKRRISDLNRDKSVKINTIVFIEGRDADPGIVELMKTIAAENGGVFRLISAADLR